MKDLVLGGFIIERGIHRKQLPTYTDPTLIEVDGVLAEMRDARGVVAVEREGWLGPGIYKVALHAEYGRYLILANEESMEGDDIVRGLLNSAAADELVDFCGEKHNARSIVHSFDLARDAFRQYFELMSAGTSLD
jgi:hypothetical protein